VKRSEARVLVVGLGGLGCPAALVLARAGIGTLGLCDDDAVERSNLHRQILFVDADVGVSKVDAAARALRIAAGDRGLAIRLHPRRLLPEDALAIVSQYDLVVEGSDNFATKFLTSDACALARVPVVHASAVRWVGTAFAVAAGGRPCYRCLFEDLPDGDAPNCADAGVMGPALGVVAAAQADMALSLIDEREVAGRLLTFDGRTDILRRHTVACRADCRLCGTAPPPCRIERIEYERYVAPACAG
jgi:adenylyltransferase/sulfurtransferase